jgi:hypothetical protein
MNVEILTLNILLTIRAHYVLQCTYFSRELFVEVLRGGFVSVSQRGIICTKLVREASAEIRRKKKASPYGPAFFNY